jgi:hypothetical protein
MRCLHPALLSITLAATPVFLFGCGGASNNPDVKIAEEAVGVKPDKENKKTAETVRDVTVVKDTKVIDSKTGRTIKETVEKTPVKITQETSEKTDVNVNVGETKATVNGQPAKPSNK